MNQEKIIDELKQEGYNQEEAEELAEIIIQEQENEDSDEKTLLETIRQGAENLINQLSLENFSFVETPAQPSKFVMMKNKNGAWNRNGPILKNKKEERDDDWETVYAPVMVPGVEDEQGDVIPANVIKEAAHDFLEQGKTKDIDEGHNQITNKGSLVESWILKEDKEYELPDGEGYEVPKGTWLAGVKPKPEVKERIEDGEITGFSIFGEAEKIDLINNAKAKVKSKESRGDKMTDKNEDEQASEPQEENEAQEKQELPEELSETLEEIKQEIQEIKSLFKQENEDEEDEEEEEEEEEESSKDEEEVETEEETEEVEEETEEETEEVEESESEEETEDKDNEDTEKTAKHKGADTESVREEQLEQEKSKQGVAPFKNKIEKKYKRGDK